MATKPYQSSLIPYEDEIMKLRRRRSPMPYAQITEVLRAKYSLTIQRAAIFKFIKVRSRGRKVYGYSRKDLEGKAIPVQARPAASGIHRSVSPASTVTSRPEFKFTPSDRYNLTRLPPEEAAAIRKKLEAEGH